MEICPFPHAPPHFVTVTDGVSALEVVRAAIHRGVGLVLDFDATQFIMGLRSESSGTPRRSIEGALELLLEQGTDLERAFVLGALVISDNDWRVSTVKRLVEESPDWLEHPNPRHHQGAPLGSLLVEATLARVAQLHPEVVSVVEAQADVWGAAADYLLWAVKRDPEVTARIVSTIKDHRCETTDSSVSSASCWTSTGPSKTKR